MNISIDNLRQQWARWRRDGDKAREELEIVNKHIQIGKDRAIQAICGAVRKGSSDRKLWVICCRLEALCGEEEDLFRSVMSAEKAREMAQEHMQQGG